MDCTLHHGDCLEVLRTLADSSVDAVVTDPPYGLKFMGKRWDHDVPGVDVWAECLRVLKPGGHLLAFFGTRTYHRGAVAVEDAGFEIRDQLGWMYGSGFPKSHDVSKAIDKAAGVEGTFGEAKSARHAGWIELGRMRGNNGHVGYQRPWMQDEEKVSNAARKYEPATEEAAAWQGWGTALKPAWEPIVLARKPLEGTVAANVLAHGVGALNVDGCRVATGETTARKRAVVAEDAVAGFGKGLAMGGNGSPLGRWPANILHDDSDEAIEVLGNARRFFYVAKASAAERDAGLTSEPRQMYRCDNAPNSLEIFGTTDGGRKPRRNHHPTVKPVALMRYLVKVVTPPGAVVLDPFMGSGTTGVACFLEGRRFVGIEREAEYVEIARQRIAAACNPCPSQSDLFEEVPR